MSDDVYICIGSVRKMGDNRKVVEIPKVKSKFFNINDLVKIKKIVGDEYGSDNVRKTNE